MSQNSNYNLLKGKILFSFNTTMKDLKYVLPKHAKFLFLSNLGGYTCLPDDIKYALILFQQSPP